jgi:hypothetical protein
MCYLVPAIHAAFVLCRTLPLVEMHIDSDICPDQRTNMPFLLRNSDISAVNIKIMLSDYPVLYHCIRVQIFFFGFFVSKFVILHTGMPDQYLKKRRLNADYYLEHS